MSERRLRPLLPADLLRLPDPCARYAFPDADDLAYAPDQGDRPQACGAGPRWAVEVTHRWGHCGVLARDRAAVVGFLTLAPTDVAVHLPAYAGQSFAGDAAVVLSAWVAPEHRGRGVGRQLSQVAAALMVRRDVTALEAIGSRRTSTASGLPVGWLEAVGFATVRPHPVSPRLRMSLQNTLRWPDLAAAWTRLTDLVQPAPEPRGVSWRESTPAAP